MRLQERRDARTRCSICHGEQGSLATCLACGTLYHGDCRGSLARCPTLGCAPGASSAAKGRRRWDARPGRPWPTGWLFLGAFSVPVVFACWQPNHPGRVGEFALTVVACYAVALFLRTAAAAVRDERGGAWKLHVVVLLSAPLWATWLGELILHLYGARSGVW